MNEAKFSIMITLFFSMSQGQNHYTVSSIDKLRENLNKYHKVDIQRRWTFQCLRDLLDAGYLKRKQRFVNDENGLVSQIPSMVTFTLKGAIFMVRRGVSGAKRIVKSMVKYLQKKDKRFPLQKDFDDGSYKPADLEDKKRLDNLLGGIGKKIE